MTVRNKLAALFSRTGKTKAIDHIVKPSFKQHEEIRTRDPAQPFCTFLGMRVNCGPLGLKGAPDFLFRNNGDGTFTDVTRQAGVTDIPLHYGLTVTWADVDDDGFPDIVVANDSRPNYLYHNRGDGTFEELGILSGLATNADGRAQAFMGMGVGDYDHDGRDDFFFTTFSNDSYTLHRNNGKLDFSDVSQRAGFGAITVPFMGWGTQFVDYDNDGWLDVFIANGHIYPKIDDHSKFTSYEQRTLLFRNLQNGTFADISGNLGPAITTPKSTRGLALGDLFNDGNTHAVLNNIRRTPTLLRSRGADRAGHWISLKLVGDPSRKVPRDAMGTVVYCTANGFRQRGEVASGRSYVSQNDLRIHFGLGKAERVDKLEIMWSNRIREMVELPAVDRFYTIVQGKGIQP